jgi:hypothetical protein
MVIQSNVLRVILEQDIPFVYPNLKWTQMQMLNVVVNYLQNLIWTKL